MRVNRNVVQSIMIRNSNIRRLLWFTAIALVILTFAAFYQKATGVGYALLALSVVSLILSFHKLTCPNCGKTMRESSAGLKNCPYCGTEYEPKEDAQQEK